MDKQYEVLHSPFNIKTHKETFVNYLEIVIDKDGVCHYAVPSHNGILEMMVCKKHKIKFEWFNFSEKAGALCPKNMYADYPEWLCKETECIMVWGDPTNKVLGKPNTKQLLTLQELEKEGLINLGGARYE